MSHLCAPPILDFSHFYGGNSEAKAKLVDEIRNSCLYNGFFQITGHRVPLDLQRRVMNCAKRFFDMPLEEKMKVDKNNNSFNHGYELLRSQMLEAGTGPELKEGFYIGEEIPEHHPYFRTSMEYYHAVFGLAKVILSVLALTLGVDTNYFNLLTNGAVATMRYLRYPAQPKDEGEKLNRGIGAHTDFGCVTLLLQDEVDGLQVLDMPTGKWLDVEPVPGAYVVNLGNLFMRMANDKYKSNIHRVINKSGRERYSTPFFFSGNPDYLCECLPNCRKSGEVPKYPPITVEEMVTASYKKSYGGGEPLTIGMLRDIDNRLGTATPTREAAGLTAREIIKENFKDFRGSHYRALFATRQLSRHTALIWAIWLTIGTLLARSASGYHFTENSSLLLTYRNYCIQSAVGIVGPLSAAFLVNTFLGRRWMMGISSIVTGVFLFAYEGVKTPDASLAFSCVTGLLSNFGMYALV
ncbi:Clavaminate synthase-like protein [Aspergillus ambiguus]|uniref:Clavaminate synthase-like protein n=1 Tax=Aspergillus ambiguus TaxID=176160 RepID=UPI003CCD68AD